ncbi:uncharacterized protein LOC144452726 [Glandiceps talaboti]
MQSAVTCKLLFYADDSALLVSGTDVEHIQAKLNKELEHLNEWLIDNKLSLHLGKTESILFGSNRKLKQCSEMQVSCGGVDIAARQCVQYLGADLDQSLSGETMAAKVVKKSHSRLKFLYRTKKFLDTNIRKLLANCLVQCHFDYVSSYWYSALTMKSKHKLQTSQNKVIRFVLDMSPRTHIEPTHFKELGWLPVGHRDSYIKLNHVHRVRTGLAPKYLSDPLAFKSHVYI